MNESYSRANLRTKTKGKSQTRRKPEGSRGTTDRINNKYELVPNLICLATNSQNQVLKET
jgi:hypothetical protein